MTKTKFLLGGAALVGGAAYLYQERVSKISHGYDIPYQKKSSYVGGDAETTGARIGSKVDDVASDLKSTYSQKREQFDREFALRASQLEEKRSDIASWTADKAGKIQDYSKDHLDKHQQQADALYKEAHKNDPRGLSKLKQDVSGKYYDTKNSLIGRKDEFTNSIEENAHSGKNILLRAGDKYIDAVNSVAVGTENKIRGVKNAVVGTAEDAKQAVAEDINSVKSRAESSKDRLVGKWNEGTLSQEEALDRKTARSLHGWGDSAGEFADDYKKDPSPGSSTGGFFSNWGKDPKERAIESYNQAKTELSRAQDDAKRYRKSWFSWGESKQTEASERANYRLEQAQKNLQSTQQDLSQYGFDLVNKVNKEWVKPVKEEVSKQAENAKSWGLSKKRSFDSQTEEAKQAASDKYKEAKYNLDKATADAKQYQKSWLNWSSDKKDEASDTAKAKLKEAQKNFEEASTSLSQYGSSLIDKANKEILNPLKDSTQQGLADVKKWGAAKYDDVAEKANETHKSLLGTKSALDSRDEKIARDARNSIRGFSSSADQFAEEELESVKELGEAKKGALINWGESKYNQSKDSAQYAYDQAQESLKQAQKEANKYKKSFFNWSSEKSSDAAQAANENLTKAQEIAAESGKNLNSWLLKSSDSAIQATKSGLDTVNDYTQRGLDKASSYVRSNS